MANSKQKEVKIKHRKRKNRKTQKRVDQLANAKKKTMREMHSVGSLPKIYQDRI